MTSIEGIIVNNGDQTRKRIEIDESGIISRVAEPTGVADLVLRDELIFPGFIDLHVHAREDASGTQTYKEDFQTAGEASINGGVVAFAEMPNNPVAPINDETYNAKKELTHKSEVEVLLYAAVGENTNPLNKKVPYKVFMGQSVGNMFFTNYPDLEKTLERYSGQNISFHCEDPKILEENKNKDTHLAKRPDVAEISAVDFAIHLIDKFNLKGKICHCSTIEGINKIITAKERGLQVTVEVTPHHLYFDETMFDSSTETLYQVNPPIRQSQENRLGLIEFLKEGHIDYIATDHAPHTVEEKENGTSGLTHLDTYGDFTTWLMKEHNFTISDIARVCSVNPANFMNEFIEKKPAPELAGRYGKIEEGYIGSLTVIDMNKPITIESKNLKTKCKWSPFLGITFPGSVVATIIKGKIYAK